MNWWNWQDNHPSRSSEYGGLDVFGWRVLDDAEVQLSYICARGEFIMLDSDLRK